MKNIQSEEVKSSCSQVSEKGEIPRSMDAERKASLLPEIVTRGHRHSAEKQPPRATDVNAIVTRNEQGQILDSVVQQS